MSEIPKVSEHVEYANIKELENGRKQNDYRGQWLTKINSVNNKQYYANVIQRINNIWIGEILIDGMLIPTYWDKNGNSDDDNFSLLRRRRSAEEKWPI